MLAVANCLFLTACGSPAIVTDLESYRDQLAIGLEQSFPHLQPAISLRFPDAKNLRVTIPQTNISLRDFYALDNCPVYTVIAQRNTVLGKVQLPSTRFVYEGQLLTGLKNCLEMTTDDQQIQQLQTWINSKQKTYQLVWADLVQNSSEIKTTLSSNQSLISGFEPTVLNEYSQALHYVVAISNHMNADHQQLENALNTLRLNAIIAKLWRTQAFIEQHLHDLSERLKATLNQLDCQTEHSKQHVLSLNKVFNQFFIARIQPFANQLDQWHYQLYPAIQLLQHHPNLSVDFTNYLATQLEGFNSYQNAVNTHLTIWHKLFKRCEVIPANLVN